ncbi:hypothetical protein A8709_32945 [Paenibacillus pectinilyticus]|uniref:RNA polymerase sigma-70 region 4 domain-containing protein n=1 Tax=Paenibacillus pectinilyticus TaxID=512399 RepID=A0A1C0ZXD6_9BACL|nr:sigma factor-like helix-turn-helix DNA-binding protein [Paenibacillus pectinilyticus]OCT12793.1 hypothetical protein A8709_32945 [Paenibacillus pectinilyticus]
MSIEWLGNADIETYRITKLSLHELLPTIIEERHASHVRAMIRDCDYILEWMETGRRPGNKRGVERLAAYQREIPTDIMEKYANKPAVVQFHDDREYVHMEYVLSLLTDRERTCYEMNVGGMWTDQEIANTLGLQRRTVREFLDRAQKKVKKYRTKPMPLYLDIAVSL